MGIKVEELKASVKSRGDNYSDEMLFQDYQNLILSYNAEAAGLSRMGIVGYVAAFRPHLAELLLVEAVKLLFICGIDTADTMLGYVEAKLNEEGKLLSGCCSNSFSPGPFHFLINLQLASGNSKTHPSGSDSWNCGSFASL